MSVQKAIKLSFIYGKRAERILYSRFMKVSVVLGSFKS